MTMPELVYLLCAFASLICTGLLWRGYRQQPSHLTFWSAMCFAALTLNSGLLVLDLIVVPDIDLVLIRAISAVGAIFTMLVGLIWEPR
jgi:hypothetical protein